MKEIYEDGGTHRVINGNWYKIQQEYADDRYCYNCSLMAEHIITKIQSIDEEYTDHTSKCTECGYKEYTD